VAPPTIRGSNKGSYRGLLPVLAEYTNDDRRITEVAPLNTTTAGNTGRLPLFWVTSSTTTSDGLVDVAGALAKTFVLTSVSGEFKMRLLSLMDMILFWEFPLINVNNRRNGRHRYSRSGHSRDRARTKVWTTSLHSPHHFSHARSRVTRHRVLSQDDQIFAR